ncbi:MAG TPA: transporter [Vicinamibacterales bacterium]|nr:transporter [Vicinamibacterales bacterium]
MTDRSRCLCGIGVLCLTIISVEPAAAQTQTGLTPRAVLVGLTNTAGESSGVSNVGAVIADLVGLEVSTAPIGSSAGGFTFTFDPVTRAFERAAPSFGPMFGERAITAGEGRASFGINYIRSTYDAFDGVSITDGSLQTVALRVGATPVVSGAAELTITTDTLIVFSNIALNSWFDVAVAVPFVTLDVTGSHRIGNELSEGSASASGVGDIALRSKIRVYPRGQGGVALGIDLRIPTGDPEAMLGAGVSRTLVSGIWSTTKGRFAPHASIGFEFWGKAFQVYDPFLQARVDAGRHGVAYDGGVEWAASDRLTVNAELMGRTLNDGGRLDYRDLPLLPNPFGITSASIATVDPRGLHRISFATGIKWNLAGTALVTANILLPVNDQGLRDHLTPVIGLDWGF